MMGLTLFFIGVVGAIVSSLGYIRGMLNDDGKGLNRAVFAFIGFLCSVSCGALGLMLMVRGSWL